MSAGPFVVDALMLSRESTGCAAKRRCKSLFDVVAETAYDASACRLLVRLISALIGLQRVNERKKNGECVCAGGGTRRSPITGVRDECRLGAIVAFKADVDLDAAVNGAQNERTGDVEHPLYGPVLSFEVNGACAQ